MAGGRRRSGWLAGGVAGLACGGSWWLAGGCAVRIGLAGVRWSGGWCMASGNSLGLSAGGGCAVGLVVVMLVGWV